MLAGHQLLAFLAALSVVLFLGRAFGELARRVGQPEVLGQFVVGVLLGPGVLGALVPSWRLYVLEGSGSAAALSGLSQLGAVLLLLVAGLEVDLRVLRTEARSGAWVAVAAIVPSLAAGVAMGPWLGLHGRGAAFLGVVLSVTAVSIVASLFLESGQGRRRYAQVLLAGGVAAELVVWVMVSVLSTGRGDSVLATVALSVGLAAAFLLVAVLAGPRLVAVAMRSSVDRSVLPQGQLTLVLALTLACAAVTDLLGLHPLLGAFVFGVLLTRSPRISADLLRRIETLIIAFFAPVFFVLAGAQVDLRRVATATSLLHIGLLLAVATAVKVLPVALAARASGIRGAEAWLVGLGANLKGGTDVLVAILGEQLGLLSVRTYTEYAVVAILTVFLTPTVLRLLQRRAPAGGEELDRLEREHAAANAHLAEVQRVLVPMTPQLRPSLAAEVVDRLAGSLADLNRLIDITQLRIGADSVHHAGEPTVGHGIATLASAGRRRNIALRDRKVPDPHDLSAHILAVSGGHDLLAIGATQQPDSPTVLSPLHNEVIDASPVDVLVAAGPDHRLPWDRIRRILVPVNATAHSRAAGELAGHLARSCGAAVVLLHVADPDMEQVLHRRPGLRPDLRYLLRPLDVPVEDRVLHEYDRPAAFAAELADGGYDLVVLGGRDRAADRVAYFGRLAESVLTQHHTPYVLYVAREPAGAGGAAPAR